MESMDGKSIPATNFHCALVKEPGEKKAPNGNMLHGDQFVSLRVT